MDKKLDSELERVLTGVVVASVSMRESGLNPTECTAALMVALGMAAEAQGLSEAEYIASLLSARKAAGAVIDKLRAMGMIPADMPNLGDN